MTNEEVEDGLQQYVFLTSASEVKGQLYTSSDLTSGTEPQMPIEQDAEWARETIWAWWRRGQNRTRVLQPKASDYSVSDTLDIHGHLFRY
jgi:hypothetical protein